jgi:hypothetical protein
MLKKLLLSGAAASGLLFAGSAQAGYISIDEFTAAPQSLNLAANGQVSSMNNGGGGAVVNGTIAGQYRDLTLNVISIGFGPDSSAVVTTSGQGVFTHVQGSETRSQTMITWDGFDADGTDEYSLNGAGAFDSSGALPDGNMNLDLSSLTEFQIGVISADQSTRWEIQVYDGVTAASVALGPLPAGIVPPGTALSISFDLFGGINFSSIDSIRLIANSPNPVNNLDTTIDFFRAVPEPLSVGLFGLGLLGLANARRRSIKTL